MALAAALCVGMVVGLDRSGRDGGSVAAHLPGVGALAGDVVAVDPDGRILLSDPAGGAVRPMPGLGAFPDRPVAVALDGRDLIGYRGPVIRLGPDGPAASHLTPWVPPGGAAALPDPFADRDRAFVVLESADDRGDVSVTVAPFAGVPAIPLGQADGEDVAGDPQALGVFAAVSAAVQPAAPPPGGTIALADTRVELRDDGRPAVVLATAAELNRAVGQARDTPVHLAVYPDPAGDRVAVVVEPPGGDSIAGGLVVLDRRGRVLAAVASGSGGPVAYVAPTWSPDGRDLAYPAFSEDGPAVGIWDLRRPVSVRVVPDPGTQLGSCVWSPDGSAVICPAERRAGAEWVVGRRTGPLDVFSDPAVPVAWLSSR